MSYTPRRDGGLAAYERVLARAGLAPVAGIDEAGRGACAGPLVVAAAVLGPSGSGSARGGSWGVPGVPGLADSKALTAQARDEAYDQIMAAALDWSVVIIPSGDIDRLGLHVCNVSGMRRALAGLRGRPGYVLTDGFPVRGLAVPALAMWKGDQVAGCVAAASIIAKVTRDRIMAGLHGEYPVYGFARHKGYSTASHMRALAEHGPCPEHRFSFVNVRGRIQPPDDPGAALDEAGAALAEGREEASLAAGPAEEPEDGHNGPIVDVIGEPAGSAASLAWRAAGA